MIAGLIDGFIGWLVPWVVVRLADVCGGGGRRAVGGAQSLRVPIVYVFPVIQEI